MTLSLASFPRCRASRRAGPAWSRRPRKPYYRKGHPQPGEVVAFFPSGYLLPYAGGVLNPHFGGFGHFNHPFAGAGFLWPGYTYPFNFQTPHLYALKARFIA